MTKYIHIKLSKIAKFWHILFGFSLIIIFNLILLPIVPKMLGAILSVENILDLHFSYSSQEVYLIFEKIGKKARTVYLLFEIIVDLPYILIYSFTYSLIIVRLLTINKIQNNHIVLYIPILLGLLDILENIGIVNLLYFYPEQFPRIVMLTSVFTSLKWIFAFFTFIVIFYLGTRWLRR